MTNNQSVADARRGNWVDRYAPEWLKPYARLARWDRPIGYQLLFWPCAFALALAAVASPVAGFNLWYLFLMFVGAVAMRGAGCTFNDIVDTDIDMQVARTRSRPIPSGAVTRRQAAIFLVIQALIGLVILLQFNGLTIGLGVASLVLVGIYPFMKRITWWPQLFLGLAFSWGALVGWTAQLGTIAWAPLFLYAGCIAWTIGYDTIYALQDIEDDALIGVKSTARLFGSRAKPIIGMFYGATYVLWTLAVFSAGGGFLFVLASLPALGLMAWQIYTLDADVPQNPFHRFLNNHWVGVALTLAILVDWAW